MLIDGNYQHRTMEAINLSHEIFDPLSLSSRVSLQSHLCIVYVMYTAHTMYISMHLYIIYNYI